MATRRSTAVRGAAYIVHLYADDVVGKAGNTMCQRDASKVNCCCSACGRWLDVCRSCQDSCLLANIDKCAAKTSMSIVSIGDITRQMSVALLDLSDTFRRLHLRNRIHLCPTLADVAKDLGIETIQFDGHTYIGVSMRK